FSVSRGNRGVSYGNPGHGLSRIVRVCAQDHFTDPLSPCEIQGQYPKPGFAEVEEPGVAPVLLCLFSSAPHNSQYFPKLTHRQKSYGLTAECKKYATRLVVS